MEATADQPNKAKAIGMVSKYMDNKEPWIKEQQSQEDGNEWHTPPIDPDFLAELLHMSAIHESALDFKARLVTMGFCPHRTNKNWVEPLKPNASKATIRKYYERLYAFYRFLPLNDFYAYMHDAFTFGNGYMEGIPNKGRTKKIGGLRRRNGRLMRVLKDDKGYCLVIDSVIKKRYEKDVIIHKMFPCSESDYYGLPRYTGAINDIILGDAARSQRIQFYDNNGYMGGIIVGNINVDDIDKDGKSKTEDEFVDNINKAQTPGNGKTVFLNFRGNDQIEDVAKYLQYIDTTVQLAKDDFKVTTETATNSLYEAHQTPAELLGTVLEKKASPDLFKLLTNYYKVVIKPIADLTIQEINSRIDPEDWIDIRPPFLIEEEQKLDNTEKTD